MKYILSYLVYFIWGLILVGLGLAWDNKNSMWAGLVVISIGFFLFLFRNKLIGLRESKSGTLSKFMFILAGVLVLLSGFFQALNGKIEVLNNVLNISALCLMCLAVLLLVLDSRKRLNAGNGN